VKESVNVLSVLVSVSITQCGSDDFATDAIAGDGGDGVAGLAGRGDEGHGSGRHVG
jgi:hypothetical protein